MKKNKLTTAVVAGLAGVAGMANAQQYINPEGTGEVLVYPYYTVNNGLNTLYSVVNTTDETKAVKVRFLESDHTLEVLDFNVYLSAFDVWTGVLGFTESTFSGHVGEPSGIHVTTDTSCAPFLRKDGEEFRPFTIDVDLDPTNTSMARGTEGHFEIIEMATFDGPTVGWADHGNTGVPADCDSIEGDWEDNNFYDTADEDLTTGGLFGSASLVNVAEGIAMTYDAVAVDDFWVGGIGSHTNPGNLFPALSQGDIESTVFVDGLALTSTYANGAESISSLFTRANVYNEYALDTIVNGKSEWVVTFPTKNFHVSPDPAILPFYQTWNGTESCHEFGLSVYDREEQFEVVTSRGISPLPPDGDAPVLCQEVNVVKFLLPGGDASGTIFASGNQITVTTPDSDTADITENGWANMSFSNNGDPTEPYVTNPIAGPSYVGLPVVGFAATQFTNAGAGEGLLAQYAGLFVHKGNVIVSGGIVN